MQAAFQLFQIFGFYRGSLSVILCTFPGYPDALAIGTRETERDQILHTLKLQELP